MVNVTVPMDMGDEVRHYLISFEVVLNLGGLATPTLDQLIIGYYMHAFAAQ